MGNGSTPFSGGDVQTRGFGANPWLDEVRQRLIERACYESVYRLRCCIHTAQKKSSAFPCRVSACQRTAGKGSRKKNVPRLFIHWMMCRGRTPPEAMWLSSFVAIGYYQASAPAVRAYAVAVTDRGGTCLRCASACCEAVSKCPSVRDDVRWRHRQHEPMGAAGGP